MITQNYRFVKSFNEKLSKNENFVDNSIDNYLSRLYNGDTNYTER